MMKSCLFLFVVLAGARLAAAGDSPNYSKLKGHEATFAAATEVAARAWTAKAGKPVPPIQSWPLTYCSARSEFPSDPLLLETVLVGIKSKTPDGKDVWLMIAAWHDVSAYESRWNADLYDEVNFSGIPWRKNALQSGTRFTPDAVSQFWKDYRETEKHVIPIVDWLFKDNIAKMTGPD